jgi:small subunit ribosomal protein S14
VAKKSMIARAKRTPKFTVRHRNRCRICGRPRGYMRRFAMCRICFRNQSLAGRVPGVVKSSW